MSRTIKAIEGHMMMPVRLGPRSTIPPVRLGLEPREMRLTGEWQRGFETMSGYAQRKLRLAFAPAPSLATANH